MFGATIQSKEQADVAQLVEQLIRNQQVVSSSLTVGSRFGLKRQFTAGLSFARGHFLAGEGFIAGSPKMQRSRGRPPAKDERIHSAALTPTRLRMRRMASRNNTTLPLRTATIRADRFRTGRRLMKALVKSKAERGLWLEDIPEPTIGINDVLIRVRYTGICGTDVHIYQWDEWAQKTIPVPMAIGHEFVGEIVEVGSNVNDFYPGRHRERRRPCDLRPVPELPGGPAASLRASRSGRGRESARRVCGIHLAADDQHLAA